MARRTTRHLDQASLDRLLAEAGKCRDAAIAVCTTSPIGGPQYLAAQKLIAAIMDTAEAITGNRDHFHAPMHSTPPKPFG